MKASSTAELFPLQIFSFLESRYTLTQDHLSNLLVDITLSELFSLDFELRKLSHPSSIRLESISQRPPSLALPAFFPTMAARPTPLSLLRCTPSRIAASTTPSSSVARRSFSLLRSQPSFPSSSSSSPFLSSHRSKAKRTPSIVEAQKRTFVPYVIDEVSVVKERERGNEREKRKEGNDEADRPILLPSLARFDRDPEVKRISTPVY